MPQSALAEAAGHEYAVDAAKMLFRPVRLDILRVHPADIHLRVVGYAAVAQRFGHGKVRVVQRHILAYDGDLALALGVQLAFHDGFPARKLGRRDGQRKRAAHGVAQAVRFQKQRYLVQRACVEVFYDVALRHVAEQRDLGLHAVGDGPIRTADEYIRLYAYGKQLLYGVLGRFALELAAAAI